MIERLIDQSEKAAGTPGWGRGHLPEPENVSKFVCFPASKALKI